MEIVPHTSTNFDVSCSWLLGSQFLAAHLHALACCNPSDRIEDNYCTGGRRDEPSASQPTPPPSSPSERGSCSSQEDNISLLLSLFLPLWLLNRQQLVLLCSPASASWHVEVWFTPHNFRPFNAYLLPLVTRRGKESTQEEKKWEQEQFLQKRKKSYKNEEKVNETGKRSRRQSAHEVVNFS